MPSGYPPILFYCWESLFWYWFILLNLLQHICHLPAILSWSCLRRKNPLRKRYFENYTSSRQKKRKIIHQVPLMLLKMRVASREVIWLSVIVAAWEPVGNQQIEEGCSQKWCFLLERIIRRIKELLISCDEGFLLYFLHGLRWCYIDNFAASCCFSTKLCFGWGMCLKTNARDSFIMYFIMPYYWFNVILLSLAKGLKHKFWNRSETRISET